MYALLIYKVVFHFRDSKNILLAHVIASLFEGGGTTKS